MLLIALDIFLGMNKKVFNSFAQYVIKQHNAWVIGLFDLLFFYFRGYCFSNTINQYISIFQLMTL